MVAREVPKAKPAAAVQTTKADDFQAERQSKDDKAREILTALDDQVAGIHGTLRQHAPVLPGAVGQGIPVLANPDSRNPAVPSEFVQDGVPTSLHHAAGTMSDTDLLGTTLRRPPLRPGASAPVASEEIFVSRESICTPCNGATGGGGPPDDGGDDDYGDWEE